jgi:hypothetical protein
LLTAWTTASEHSKLEHVADFFYAQTFTPQTSMFGEIATAKFSIVQCRDLSNEVLRTREIAKRH